MKHITGCHLGDNWKNCPVCVENWNDTCSPQDIMECPFESSGLDIVSYYDMMDHYYNNNLMP